MKRLILITILALALPAVLSAQIGWTEHIVGDLGFAYAVYAIDMDGDGDVDVLGAGFTADEITWWENDGSQNFTEYTIAGNFDAANSVFAIDLDDDGDVDVLGTAFTADDIIWWENMDDTGTSWTEHTIDTLFDGANSVFAIDLDDDGDVDVLGAAFYADEITWWENDGNENLTEHTIDSTFEGASGVFAIDINGDNDIDVLGAAGWPDHSITWWENDGNENFTEHTITDNFDYANSVYAIDMDGDLDVDVLGTAGTADEITWWENLDGTGTSWTEHTIDTLFDGAVSVYAIDLDGDNDVDVLGAAGTADEITWWENDGSQNFTEYTIAGNFDGANSVFAIDLDGDGDVDVLGAAPYAGEITWWESDLLTINDVALVSIDIPSILLEGTTLNPQATVTNLGTNTETFFAVTCKIEPGGYMQTEGIVSLAPGDSIPVTFLSEFTFESGPYTVTVYTRLEGDDSLANDTLVKVINTTTGIAEGGADTPETFSFIAPTINRGKVHIKLALPVETEVDLLVYDAIGRLSETLVSRRFSAGTHKLNVNLDLPAGVYFYNLKTGTGRNIIKKFLLVE